MMLTSDLAQLPSLLFELFFLFSEHALERLKLMLLVLFLDEATNSTSGLLLRNLLRVLHRNLSVELLAVVDRAWPELR